MLSGGTQSQEHGMVNALAKRPLLSLCALLVEFVGRIMALSTGDQVNLKQFLWLTAEPNEADDVECNYDRKGH